MNVLIFVMTMIMLLSLLTYARVETYFNAQIFQELFNGYMENKERSYINEIAPIVYDSVRFPREPGKPKSPNVNATSRLSLNLLRNKKERETKQTEWQQRIHLLKNLIANLYGNQPFFQNLIKERPSFIDEMIAEIIQAVDSLPEDQKLKQITDLSNLKLTDPQLDTAFYKMLHGAMAMEKKEATETIEATEAIEEPIELTEDEEAEEQPEYKSPEGYFSLLDYIDFSNKPKIRVYLAPKKVLEAIFLDLSTVDAIIAERKALHRQAVNKADTKELSNRFQAQFDPRRDSAIDSSLLDYSVTTTNPK